MSASETDLLPEPDECPFCGAPSHAALLAEVERLYGALIAATATIAGAGSAYATYACRHRSVGRGRADPFFTTRLRDMRNAEQAARAALEQSHGG